jgi:hypothetical protein
MMLGMTLQTFTAVHVVISLIAILAGFLVVVGFFGRKPLGSINTVFFTMTVLTSITGFMFPINGVTPGIVVGAISLAVLAIAGLALYARHLSGPWRSTYVITAMLALYFNVFVLIVQSFQKVPELKALAPTQSEPPFAITQVVVLCIFIALTILAVKKFRLSDSPSQAKSKSATA